MPDQEARAAVIVTLPAEIDLTSQEYAYDQLYAAFASGAAVVVADFSATAFCDCESLRRLLAVAHRAVAHDVQFRLSIPPGGLVHRLAALVDLNRRLPVYPSAREAATAGSCPPQIAPVPPRRTSKAPAMADIIRVAGGSHLHILCWQARLGQLRRHREDPACASQLAVAWDTVASLIDLHMSADDEVCGPVINQTGPQGRALARETRNARADISEIIRETSLQPPGSPPWWSLATAALAAWAGQCDQEEHGPLADCRRSLGPAVRDRLAGQWRAFTEACIRDQSYPDAPPGLPTCQLRQSRPATPRLADPVFSPLACTCQHCTVSTHRQAYPDPFTLLTAPAV